MPDPCLYTGYQRDSGRPPRDVYDGPGNSVAVTGTANGDSCLQKLPALFPKEKSCPISGPHSFKCIHQPDFVVNSPNFLVFENFYYVSTAVEVKGESASPDNKVTYPLITTPKEFKNAATRVCTLSWADVQGKGPMDSQSKDNDLKWCFSSSYAYSFLVNGLGLPEDKRITTQKFVEDSEIEWALGAALKEASEFLKRSHLRQQS